jgi:hypothetical protein
MLHEVACWWWWYWRGRGYYGRVSYGSNTVGNDGEEAGCEDASLAFHMPEVEGQGSGGLILSFFLKNEGNDV